MPFRKYDCLWNSTMSIRKIWPLQLDTNIVSDWKRRLSLQDIDDWCHGGTSIHHHPFIGNTPACCVAVWINRCFNRFDPALQISVSRSSDLKKLRIAAFRLLSSVLESDKRFCLRASLVKHVVFLFAGTSWIAGLIVWPPKFLFPVNTARSTIGGVE